jgi:hypothetical protein
VNQRGIAFWWVTSKVWWERGIESAESLLASSPPRRFISRAREDSPMGRFTRVPWPRPLTGHLVLGTRPGMIRE